MLDAFTLADVLTPAGLAALGQVILIDVLLAGDNAMVLGALAADMSPRDRKRVLAIGIVVALVLRIGFALIATQLLDIIGLLLAGGLLLLWVAWKLFRELRPAGGDAGANGEAGGAPERPRKTLLQAVIQVAITDLSMSLDNVLAVTGAARAHPLVLVFGLALSVTLMGFAANIVARLIGRYGWLGYLGLAVIVYVSISMIYHGIMDPRIGVMQVLS